MLQVGDKAPDFTLKDASEQPHTLSSFAGKKVVLYFYPKDDTPGCTVEACSFRDAYDDMLAKGAVVIGLSPDEAKSHARFRDKFNLPFHLLCDTDHAVAEQYGVWGEKQNYGKTYMGILRTTFLIDETGIIRHVFAKVKPEGHGDQILALL